MTLHQRPKKYLLRSIFILRADPGDGFQTEAAGCPHKSHRMNLKRIVFSSLVLILDHSEKHQQVTERCEREEKQPFSLTTQADCRSQEWT